MDYRIEYFVGFLRRRYNIARELFKGDDARVKHVGGRNRSCSCGVNLDCCTTRPFKFPCVVAGDGEHEPAGARSRGHGHHAGDESRDDEGIFSFTFSFLCRGLTL